MAKTQTPSNPIAAVKADYDPSAIRSGIKSYIASVSNHRKVFASLTGEIAGLKNQQRQLLLKQNALKDKLSQGITKEEAPNERQWNAVLAGRCEASKEYQGMVDELEAVANNLVAKETALAIAKADIDSAREEMSAHRQMSDMYQTELKATVEAMGALAGVE